ncbi:hypothetical protein PR048_032557 [Dryococelus australis]|uniref:Uncharacterized protein n=1 Tax=Dryococelus australis TaxID=614101 RepID=A0ABQ9G5D8_9NEOP|nr:hypothetical protein PR048_032557 [Dryococelus australis]
MPRPIVITPIWCECPSQPATTDTHQLDQSTIMQIRGQQNLNDSSSLLICFTATESVVNSISLKQVPARIPRFSPCDLLYRLGFCMAVHVIRQYRLPSHLTSGSYLLLLQDRLAELLEDVPLKIQQAMWFQHDDKTLHFVCPRPTDPIYHEGWKARTDHCSCQNTNALHCIAPVQCAELPRAEGGRMHTA